MFYINYVYMTTNKLLFAGHPKQWDFPAPSSCDDSHNELNHWGRLDLFLFSFVFWWSHLQKSFFLASGNFCFNSGIMN